jgi:hypothetical protein
MGDMLWYLSAVAYHQGLKLSDIASPQIAPQSTITFTAMQPQQDLPFAFPSVATGCSATFEGPRINFTEWN